MTAVGKILVFFNLIFSLVVGAFVVFTYISQTHWAHEYNDLAQRYAVVDASNAAYQKQHQQDQDYAKLFNDQVLKDGELEKMTGLQASDTVPDKLDKIKKTLKAALDEAKDKGQKLKDKGDELTTAQTKLDAQESALAGARAEADKHQTETADTRTRLAAEEKKSLAMITELGHEHDLMVKYKIDFDTANLRAEQLEKENDKLARDNQRLVANGGSATTALKPKEGPNPPLDSVEGMVSEVDPSGLVRITIGSDAGLVTGNTLEVYRLNTLVPDQSKYLGRIRLIQVRNTEAVGQLMGKPTAPPQAGDTVSSRIVGG